MTDVEHYHQYLDGDESGLSALMARYGDALTVYIDGYMGDIHEADAKRDPELHQIPWGFEEYLAVTRQRNFVWKQVQRSKSVFQAHTTLHKPGRSYRNCSPRPYRKY